MKRGMLIVVCGMIGWMLADLATAADRQGCEQLRGQGAGLKSEMQPYQATLKLLECAGMTKDVAALDALDRDILIIRAKSHSLKELREKQTETNPPIKYSKLTSASRLAKLKQLVDDYYKPQP